MVKSQGDAIGEIGLALRYRQDKELLMIRVVSAHGLASRQVARLSVDPQVLSLKYVSGIVFEVWFIFPLLQVAAFHLAFY